MILHTRLLWFCAGLTVNQRLIVINPRYRDDKPLLAHEECHQEQMGRSGTFTFWWKYLTSSEFRKQSEVEAYKAQISDGSTISSCAFNLATMYHLNLDYGTAYNLLKD